MIMLRMMAAKLLSTTRCEIMESDLHSLADSLKQEMICPVEDVGAGEYSSVPSSKYTGEGCVVHGSSSSD